MENKKQYGIAKNLKRKYMQLYLVLFPLQNKNIDVFLLFVYLLLDKQERES